MAQNLYIISFLQKIPDFTLNRVDFSSDLHVTLASDFSIQEKNRESLIKRLGDLARWFPPMVAKPLSIEEFGQAERTIMATVLDSNVGEMSLANLHFSLLQAIKEVGGKFNDERFIGSQYKPHISHFLSSESQILNSMSLIEHTEGFGKGILVIKTWPFTYNLRTQ